MPLFLKRCCQRCLTRPTSKPRTKAIQAYCQTLKAYHEHGVGQETALRSAFQNLLAEIAKTRYWLLVSGQSNHSSGKRVVPDDTLYDHNNLHRGYWEAEACPHFMYQAL
jgi:hypothetical protein